MATAQFFLGASLFVLLLVDMHCLPVKKGFNPSASHGSSYTYTAPGLGSNQAAPAGEFSSGGVMPSSAYSHGVSAPSYQPVPQPDTGFYQPEPAAPVSSGPSSRPVHSGYSGGAVRPNPVSSMQPGAPLQPASQDINWAVAPPGIFSGGEAMSAHAHGGHSSSAENVSPPLPPPGPMYQAGELSHFEQSLEHGDYQMESEEEGYMPPPPPPPMDSSSEGFTSQPQPDYGLGGSWGVYPYYDYMFLTGQYPPGTVTHFSSNFEQGGDHWQDVHYVRDYAPYNAEPVQQPQTFTDLPPPQQPPVKTQVGH